VLTLGPSAGSLEIGVLLSLFLFGINTAQAYAYARKFRDDPTYLKALVITTWFVELISACLRCIYLVYFSFLLHANRLLELAHTAFITVALYKATAMGNSSNPGIIGGTSLILSLFPSSLVSVSVQVLFPPIN
jgi:hypothetical protein